MNGIFFAYQTGKSGSEVVFLLPQIVGFQDDTNYVAIGGVTPENIPEFRKAGCLGVGLASSLMPKDKAPATGMPARNTCTCCVQKPKANKPQKQQDRSPEKMSGLLLCDGMALPPTL